MKKAILIASFFLIIVFIISIFFIKMQAVSYSPEKVLEDAFDSSGATRVGSELYLRGKLPGSGGFDPEGAGRLMGDILDGIGAVGPRPAYKDIDNGHTRGIELDMNLDDAGRSMHAGIVSERDGQAPGDSYITVSIVCFSGTQDLAGTRAALEKTLKARGIGPKFNSCITGRFEGKKDDRELNEACARIFASADARKVEGIREGNLISVSAFSKAIREAVDDSGGRVNLNLAIRYNSFENKTYLWLATPVITTEY